MSDVARSRLERAMSAFLRFCDEGAEREPFLAAHDDLRDLLEPMLDEAPDADHAADTVLGGDFRLGAEIGRGGTGVVYAARQVSLGRRVAVKVLPRHLLLTPSTIARFRREAKTIAALDHPGIVRMLSVGADGDTHWFAMERIEGRSLAAHLGDLQRDGVQPATCTHRMVELAAQIADALHHAHELGIVHRDVKPSNVLLRHDGTPVLIDFGLARDDSSPSITAPDGRAGTPCYMAPEQIRGAADHIDRRSDVFALGATLYEMLTFRRAFDSGSPDLSMRRVLDEEPLEPRRRNPAVSRDLAAVVATALAKEPRHRYPTAAAFAADLRACLAHGPIRARPVGPLARLWRWSRRRKALAGALFGLFTALVGGLAVSLSLWQTAAAEERRASSLLGDWERLADRRRLDELVLEADKALWPAVPSNLPAMRAWLSNARQLVARLPDHEAALMRMQAGVHAREGAFELAWRQRQLELLVQGLTALVADDRHATTIAGVEYRRQQAENLTATLAATNDAWTESRKRIAANPRYAGLSLAPQLGLVPLGPDPASGLEEFADTGSGELPTRGPDGVLSARDKTAVVFVLLPGGDFTMGAQRDDPAAANYDPDAAFMESPPQAVRLDPFFLAKFEVTQAQWHQLMGDAAGTWQPGLVVRGVTMGWRSPVTNVTWDQCATMVRHCGWQLPTEAQWECACRAGTATPWSTGREAASLFGMANLADEASRDEFPLDWSFHRGVDDGHAVPAPVGTYQPNRFGLYDLHGNVSEWCRDVMLRYDNAVRPGDGERLLPTDRQHRFGESPHLHVHRGGSFATMAVELRSAQRAAAHAGMMLPSLGVRPARALER